MSKRIAKQLPCVLILLSRTGQPELITLPSLEDEDFTMLRLRPIIGLLIFAAVINIVHSYRCLNTLEEVSPKRVVHFNRQSLNIQFGLSRRVTQRLVSRIMKIFLTEVLGYSGVTVVEKDDAFDILEVFESLSEIVTHAGYRKLPEIMVNMEVWIPPGLDTMPLLNKYDVKEVGAVSLPGHFGWFVPEALSKPDDSWMTFAKRESASRFDVDEPTLAIIKNYTVDPATRQYYCRKPYCNYGMYIPERCRGTRGHKAEPCALLLASDPDVTGFAKDHIDKLELYVKIAWVGPQVKSLMDSLIDQYVHHSGNSSGRTDQRSLVILHWTPSDVIPNDTNFTTIEFPRCGAKGLEIGCAYEANRLVKLVWARLDIVAKFAYEAISRARFSPEMYEDLIDRHTRFSGSATEEEIACGWLKDNLNYSLAKWSPNSADKNMLYIGGIFPMSGIFYTAKSIIIAAKMAKDAINQNNTILRDYNITLLASDGQCKSDMVMKSFIDYMVHNYFEKLIGVLGPACSETVEPLIGISRHYKTVVISYSAEGSSFNNRERYPYFFRTIGENKQYNLVYLQFLQFFGWHRVASIAEDGQKYTEYISYMQDTLRENGINFVANVKFPRERETYTISKHLQELKEKRAKIIIADVYDPIARQVMCEAYKLEMTALQGYVWFLPLWLRPHWYDTDYYNLQGPEEVDCTTEEMKQSINGHLGLSHAYYANDDEIMQENITVRQWRERYEEFCTTRNLVPSNYAGFAYDAMWTYAFAMDRLLRENQSYVFELHSDQTVNRLTDIIAETDFKGLSGRIKFIGGSSRYSVITIVQRIDNEIRQIGNFYPNITESGLEVTGGVLDLNVSALVWLSNRVPDDGSEPPKTCVLSGLANLLDVSCEVAIVVVNIIGFSVIGALLIVGFIIVKRKYEEKLRQHEKYMKSFGLDPSFTADMSGLDKWEIPRDRVVINRKIGEGAFGTVYGGEAFFAEKGWLAVAVKTLKVGSTTEEKLDFLSEVEVMKKFDHKNIIKLLAVCIKAEPVLTVMEFMLYGDLKTYLLARRHLVNDRSYEDSDEISNKRLTSMALDVARALSYLAQLKYIHRDVASRNCLVNAQRVIKLGDFGMTRPMYTNDYYKFNRRGMLPVRWMAPESLGLGIFTPASDVWSYGVLLYEIVTFGSFPFQGMSNNQVLTHVKAGNSLVVPKGVKPQLEGLMYSCWVVEHAKRPTAPEIVDFLASNPRLLAPCLDVPLASVQLEHNSQIEMLELPENLRKFSVPRGWPTNDQTKPSTEESPDSPLLDISCQEQTTVQNGGPALQRNNLTPLFPPPGASIFADFARKREKVHKYVNLQPGQPDKPNELAPLEDRNVTLSPKKENPANISIF